MSKQLICNKCGKQFDRWDEQENYHVYAKLGFGSRHDGCRLELDLCCSCMDALIEECAVSPIIEE